jgi:hypothetical protein
MVCQPKLDNSDAWYVSLSWTIMSRPLGGGAMGGRTSCVRQQGGSVGGGSLSRAFEVPGNPLEPR